MCVLSHEEHGKGLQLGPLVRGNDELGLWGVVKT